MSEKNRYRHEFKYLLDTRSYYILKTILSAMMEMDDHASERGYYNIRSLYFDDQKNTDFFGKLSGIADRKKIRLRCYDFDPASIFFEKKTKENNASYKISAKLDHEAAVKAANGDLDWMIAEKKPLLREISLMSRMNGLKPSVITDYTREPYICREGNVRITFDRQLSTALTSTDIFNKDLPLIPAMGRGETILEVKYDAFIPSYITSALARIDAVQLAISKYALCRRFISSNDWEVI